MNNPKTNSSGRSPVRRRQLRTFGRGHRGFVLLLALGAPGCNRQASDAPAPDDHIDAIHDWCDGTEACNPDVFSERFTSHSACVAMQQAEAQTNAAFYADYGPECHAAHAAATRCTLESATCDREAGDAQFVANIDECTDQFETFAAACNRQ